MISLECALGKIEVLMVLEKRPDGIKGVGNTKTCGGSGADPLQGWDAQTPWMWPGILTGELVQQP